MIIKKIKDHYKVDSNTCGTISEILKAGEYEGLDLAVLKDVSNTKGHFHKTFDEIYLIAEGEMRISFYDPSSNKQWEEEFCSDELCLIKKGIHHKIVSASSSNKLYVICVPGFVINDEHLSDKL